MMSTWISLVAPKTVVMTTHGAATLIIQFLQDYFKNAWRVWIYYMNQLRDDYLTKTKQHIAKLCIIS